MHTRPTSVQTDKLLFLVYQGWWGVHLAGITCSYAWLHGPALLMPSWDCPQFHACQPTIPVAATPLPHCLAELLRAVQTFTPLVDKCKSLNRAMRIGTNHGSLSARILSYYGDTPRCCLPSHQLTSQNHGIAVPAQLLHWCC